MNTDGRRHKLKLALPVLLVAGMAVPARPAGAAQARIESAFTSDSRDSVNERTVFAPDTPKVYVLYRVADLPRGARLRIVWYADHAEGVADNSRIDEASTSPGAGTFMGAFSYSRPTRGWPVGTYHAELFIDDRLEKAVRFRVARP